MKKSGKKRKIVIVGSFGGGNLGDEALLQVVVSEIFKCANTDLGKREFKSTELVVLSGNVFDTMLRVRSWKIQSEFAGFVDGEQMLKNKNLRVVSHFPFGVRSFFSFAWLRTFWAIRGADFALIGPGGLFNESEGLRAIFLWWFQIFCFRFYGLPIILFANSIGPVRSFLGRFLVRSVLRRAEKIYLREDFSLLEIRKIFDADFFEKKIFKKCELIADPILLFPVSVERKILNRNSKEKILALNLRIDAKLDLNLIKKFLDFCRQDDWKILFVAMEISDKALLNQLTLKEEQIFLPTSYQDFLAVLKPCDLVLGMRLHFLLGGVLVGARVGGWSYNLKVAGVLDNLNLSYRKLEELNEFSLKMLLQEAESVSECSLNAGREILRKAFLEVFLH